MNDVKRVAPREALDLHGQGALIVATYPEARFRGYAYIEQAVSVDTFQAMLPKLDRKRCIVFY